MTIENATTIAQLNDAWPLFDDQIVEGDDHIRLLKTVLKNDAVVKSLGTLQTIVGPVTVNGLLTGKGNLRVEHTTPFIDFRESDQTLPAGLYRFALSGNVFSFLRNTAPAGDFTAATALLSYTPADNYLNFTVSAKFIGIPRIESAQPSIIWRETDQTLPGGLYRAVASSGNYHIQFNTAVGGDFSGAVDILKYTASTGRLSFGVPVDLVVSGYLPTTGGTLTGNLLVESTGPVVRWHETDAVSPLGFWHMGAYGAGSFQLVRVTAADWSTSENIFRVFPPAVGPPAYPTRLQLDVPISSTLNIMSGAPRLDFTEADQADPVGRFRFYADGGNFVFQRSTSANWANPIGVWHIDGATLAFTVYNATSFDANVTIGKSDTTATVLGLRGTGASNYIDNYATTYLYFRSQPGGVLNARLDLVGTAAAHILTIMTREKGDARYVSLVGANAAPVQVGSIYIGGSPAGTAVGTHISAVTGQTLTLRGGTDTNQMTQFVDATGNQVARIDVGDTASTVANTIITRQKGDARYLGLVAGGTVTGTLVTEPITKLATIGQIVEVGSATGAYVDFKRTANPNYLRVPDGASLRVLNVTGTAWASVSSTAGWAAGTSDARLKENVIDSPYGLETVMALRPVEFDWIEEKRHDIGFIAQEVQPLIPEIVEVWKADPGQQEGLDTWALRKDALTVVLVRAVQEQQEQIGALARRVIQLEARL